MNFDKAYDLLDGVRERLETTIPNSSVDLMPSDTDDFFITVTQRNETTGNESKWSFCVDFGTNKVQMLEPTEDEESFSNDNEVFGIIKNFLNGGSSREKRRNRLDYDSGKPIKITGFGNKIGSSKKSIKSGYVIKVTETDNDNTYSPTYVNGDSWQSKEPQIFETEEDAQEQAEDFRKYLNKRVRSLGGHWQYKLEIVKSSHKPIKSSWFKPEDTIAYLVGGPADMITSDDKAQADNYDIVYYGYGIMDDGEKGHLFIGKYKDIKSYIEDYMGAAVADEYIYSYKINGAPVTESFQYLATNPLPTEKDYQDIVNKLNEYVDKEYGREFGTGSIYHFNKYKGQDMNNDGYGNEYPNYVIFDTEGNLDMHSDDDIVEYIRKILDEKGWYAEPVSAADNFTIAIK